MPGIPRDFAVEIPTLVSKRGIAASIRGDAGRRAGSDLAGPSGPGHDRLAAYDEGSRERLLELVLADPWTQSLEQAATMVAEILAMPGHAAMREHYQ